MSIQGFLFLLFFADTSASSSQFSDAQIKPGRIASGSHRILKVEIRSKRPSRLKFDKAKDVLPCWRGICGKQLKQEIHLGCLQSLPDTWSRNGCEPHQQGGCSFAAAPLLQHGQSLLVGSPQKTPGMTLL